MLNIISVLTAISILLAGVWLMFRSRRQDSVVLAVSRQWLVQHQGEE